MPDLRVFKNNKVQFVQSIVAIVYTLYNYPSKICTQ